MSDGPSEEAWSKALYEGLIDCGVQAEEHEG